VTADGPSQVALVTRLMREARGLLVALEGALDQENPEEARAAVRAYLRETGALIAGVEPPATPPEPPRPPADADDPERAARRWVRSFAALLSDWQLDEAERTAGEPPEALPPRLAEVPALLHGGVRAIRSGRHGDALDLLEFLLHARELTPREARTAGAPRRRHFASRPVRSLLHVYLGRVALFDDGDTERALEHFLAAVRKAPDDGTVQAALGSYYQVRGDFAEALTAYQHSVALAPGYPDGYVGMGWLAEVEDRPEEASDWYARALEVAEAHGDVDRRLARLRAPVPPLLLLEAARSSADGEPQVALERLDEALRVTLWDSNLLHRIHVLRGDILVTLERPKEAAEAYYQAADALGEASEEYRAELLDQAIRLDGSHQAAHWDLAEALRLRSFETSAEVERLGHVDRALRIWTRSFQLAPPPPEFAWSYVSRALLSERRIDLGADDGLELYWEAANWLEQALLRDEDGYGWLHLARMQRMLELTSNAVETSELAVTFDPVNVDALTEHATALVWASRTEEAEEALDRALEEEPTSMWLRTLRGWVWAFTGRGRDALELCDEMLAELEQGPNARAQSVEILALRARAHRTLEDRPGELADHEEIIRRTEPDDALQSRTYARAEYALGVARADAARLVKARRTFEALAEDPLPHDAGLDVERGLAGLATGDVERGAELLRAGLAGARAPTPDIDDIVAELELVRPIAPEEAQSLIDDLASQARARLETVQGPTPCEELRPWLQDERFEPAATLALARLHRGSGSWRKALALTAQLPERDRAPHLAGVIEGLTSEADAHLRDGNAGAARELLEAACRVPAETGDIASTPTLLARLALARLRTEDPEGAHDALAHAFAAFRRAGSDDPPAAWWEACGHLTSGADEIWRLDELLESVGDGARGQTPARRPLAFARHLMLSADMEENPEPMHDLRPVGRLGDSLIPSDTGPTWSLFSTHLPAAAQRVRKDTGLVLPGIRFGAAEDLTPREYQLIVSGLSALRQHIRSDVFADPAADPIEEVVRELETVLRRCLAEFVGVDDVVALLEQQSQVEGAEPPPLGRLAKLRLTRVVRTLATDRVPLEWPALLDAMGEAGGDTAETVARVRRVCWQSLPGNEQGRSRAPLPAALEEQILSAFEPVRRVPALSVSPVEATRLQGAIVDWLATIPSGTAVVTDSQELRPLVQRLIWPRDPDRPVLSRPESAEAMSPDQEGLGTGDEISA
jgi:tetratricopeptide (TPR) repeat protein